MQNTLEILHLYALGDHLIGAFVGLCPVVCLGNLRAPYTEVVSETTAIGTANKTSNGTANTKSQQVQTRGAKASGMQAVFVRHGQSTANAGEWNQPFATIALTPMGWEQARALAETWTFTPSRIVLSPFLRARQTAEPTMERFPDVPVETWDIYEFTHWDMAHWAGSAPEMEPEEVAKFFRVADPGFRRGGAETFAEFLGRAETTLDRLAGMQVEAPVVLFTHGHFMQAVRQTVMFPEWTAEQKMQAFRQFDEAYKVKNVQKVWAEFNGRAWTID
jgi:broad specificity phosphatase PhoE